ncbi:MAG: hypothetical protein U0610_24935 [bacterium]
MEVGASRFLVGESLGDLEGSFEEPFGLGAVSECDVKVPEEHLDASPQDHLLVGKILERFATRRRCFQGEAAGREPLREIEPEGGARSGLFRLGEQFRDAFQALSNLGARRIRGWRGCARLHPCDRFEEARAEEHGGLAFDPIRAVAKVPEVWRAGDERLRLTRPEDQQEAQPIRGDSVPVQV